MNAVLLTVHTTLPPPTCRGADLPCDGRGEFVLSKLPLSIQWEIVQRLDVRDVARLTVLSRYWYNFLGQIIPWLLGRHAEATEHSTAAERRSTVDDDLSLHGALSAQAAIGVAAAMIRESQHKEVSSVGRDLNQDDRISFLPDCLRRKIVARLPLRDALTTRLLSHRWCHGWISTPPPPHLRTTEGQCGNLNQDRISFLPDYLRRKIVARLPIRDAVRTRVLSRRWCHDWSSTPLHLDDGHLLRSTEDQRVERLSKLLMEHPGPFSTIRLCFTHLDHCRDALSQWVSLLADKGVGDLVLVNCPLPVDVPLPVDILHCTSVRRLCLGFLRFPSTSGHRRVIFRELREIGLHCVRIESADLSYLVRSSPMLNTLGIVCSYGYPDNIRIHGHKNLQSIVLWSSVVNELSIHDSNSVHRLILSNSGASQMTLNISNVPSLELLGYLEPGYHKLVINRVLIQAGTKPNPRMMVPTVKILGCKLSFGDKDQSKMLPAFLRCFPHVETLHIQSVQAISPTGKLNLSTWLAKGDAIECVDQHVKNLIFHHFHGERSEVAFLKFVWRKAKLLEKMVIILSAQALDREDETRSKLIELGCSDRASKEPHLLVTDDGIPMMFHTACNASVRDPFYSMDELELSTDEDDQEEAVGIVTPVVKLSSGHMMPMVSLGMPYGGCEMGKHMICNFINGALQSGCRHFDLSGDLGTARLIGEALAEACKDGIVKREELYISINFQWRHNEFQTIKDTLGLIHMDYIDLYLIGKPRRCHGNFLWDQVELALSEGLIRDIGLRNWNIHDIETCLRKNIIPVVNQVVTDPYQQHVSLHDFCRKHGIYIMGGFLDVWNSSINDPTIKSLAIKYSKTPVQVIHRWSLQRGIGVILFPGSSKMDMLRDCFEGLFDFNISANDMETIKALDRI